MTIRESADKSIGLFTPKAKLKWVVALDSATLIGNNETEGLEAAQGLAAGCWLTHSGLFDQVGG
jgi:hypothetical protein